MRLFHYTCHHGHLALGKVNDLLPMHDSLGLIWLTDLDAPFRQALGLTMDTIACDRTRYRYRVVDTSTCVPWVRFARGLAPGVRKVYETVPGVRPRHWWVSRTPVPVTFDPVALPQRIHSEVLV